MLYSLSTLAKFDIIEGMTHNCDTHHLHAPKAMGGKVLFSVVLNIIFIVVQVWYGIKAHSLALLADAGHNLGDVLGLILAGVAIWLATLKPMKTYTFGLQSATILATLANAMILLMTVFEISHEAIERLIEGVGTPQNFTVMVVASIAVIVNGLTAWLIHGGQEHDLNIRGMYLHLLSDVGVSVAVVVGAGLCEWTGQNWIDPVVSLFVAVVILVATWNLLKRTLRLALQGVPSHIKAGEIEKTLREQEGVSDVHDLHIWALGTQQTAMSVHLVMPAGHPGDAFIDKLGQTLERHGINHSTFQIEIDENKHCGCDCGC